MLRQHLFPYQGHISAALILGGVDIHGPALHMIHPHGSSDQVIAHVVFRSDFKATFCNNGLWFSCGYGSTRDTMARRDDS